MNIKDLSDTESHKPAVPPLIPPLFRFLIELTTWLWFIIAAITVHVIFFVGFILSAVLLGAFNAPGDKTREGPINVTGYHRVTIEIFSGFLGVIGAWVLFKEPGLILQSVVTLVAFTLDFERWAWLLGLRTTPPESITRIHSMKKK
ncbi:MAG: hypothetical protein ACFFE8_10880 [Candidatus Heimdallarchaeota archaeon]